jgi:hypothetical protein
VTLDDAADEEEVIQVDGSTKPDLNFKPGIVISDQIDIRLDELLTWSEDPVMMCIKTNGGLPMSGEGKLGTAAYTRQKPREMKPCMNTLARVSLSGL